MKIKLQKKKWMNLRFIFVALLLQVFCFDLAVAEGDAKNSEQTNQSRTVTGKVTDQEDGSELPGVNVLIKGTASGTVTDFNGAYSINVPDEDAVLVFSYVGYTPEEVQVNGRSNIDVAMTADVTQLDELVIVDDGYSTIKRTDMTGSVASISGKELRKVPVASAAEAITGRLPGVNVMTTDGSPDAEVVIRVRGGGSVTQDNSPLYVVDGFIVSTIRDIPPTDITSINVLKDAAATAIYGAQAANGVIVVTTKSPEAGRTSVSYNGFVQTKQLPGNRKFDVLSPYEFVMAQYEFAKLRSQADLDRFERFFGKYDDLELYQYKPGTDWQDELFGDPQISQYHNLSISGGSEKTRLSLSLTHNDDEGILRGNGFNRSVLNFKLNHEISPKLQLDASTRITNTVVNGAGTSGAAQLRVKDAIATRPVNGIADELDIDLNSLESDDDYQAFLLNFIDPTELVDQDWRERTTNNYVLNAGLGWAILDNLRFKTTFTTETSFDNNLRYYGPLTSQSRQEGNSLPLGTKEERTRYAFRWLNTLNYDFNIDGPHDLNILLGQEIYSRGGKGNFVRAENFRYSMQPEELFANMQLGTTDEHNTSEFTAANRSSFFGRANYQLNDRYLLTATFRVDASSRFSKENRVGFFPALALGWKMEQEPFMQAVDFVDQLKLRLTYGETGNDRIDEDAFRFLFSPSTNNGPGMGTNAYNAYYSPAGSVLYNPLLLWETTVNRNAGLDFTLFKAKITGSFDAYWNTTRDLLLESAISQTSGFAFQYNNVGSTSNKGLELAINAYVIENDDFTFSVNANFGMNDFRIEELDGTNERFYQSNWASTDLKDRDDFFVRKGGKVGDIYGYVTDGYYTEDDFEYYDEITGQYVLKSPEDGVYDNRQTLGVSALRPGYLKLKDLNGDSLINSLDRQVIGNALPVAQGGFGFNSSWKGFDLTAFFNWSLGNDLYNTGKIEYNQFYRTSFGNLLNTMSSDNRYSYIDVDGSYTGTPGEVVTDLEQLREMNQGKNIWSPTGFGQATPVIHSWAVEDGSFIRLNTLTLGYTVPNALSSRIGISNARFYVTGYNLWLWTKYSGYDPDVSTTRRSSFQALTPGVDYSSYPRSRSFTVGVNVTF